MRALEKSGWIALGITLLSVIIAACIFVYNGPGKIERNIVLLGRADIYEAVLPRAIKLHEALNDRDGIHQEDARGHPINEVTFPIAYTSIFKDGDSLNLYFGGGFLQYGYRLERTKTGEYRFILAVEERAEKILK